MSTKYRISARILPYDVPNNPGTVDDARLEEKKILVPMSGSQTIGDLYLDIQRMYSELYNQAGELRIRCLETGDGDLLHTSLLISDCFEKKGSTGDKAQWTVVVKRQAPTAEEIAEYVRNARQFSFDNLSFVKPQIPYSRGLLDEAQELSATPLKRKLSSRAPVETDTKETLVQSTERDEQDLQTFPIPRGPPSPSLVPSSQLLLNTIHNPLNNVLNKAVQEQSAATSGFGILVPGRTTSRMFSDTDELQDPEESRKPSKKLSRAKPTQNTIGRTPQTKKKTDKKPPARDDVFDVKSVDEASPQALLQPRRPLSEEERLPQKRLLTPLGNGADVSSLDTSKRRKVANHNTDRSTTKLRASLAQEHAEVQELVSTLPFTPSHRRSHKLTPFFPHGTLTPGSTQSRAVGAATDAGMELLGTDKLSPQNNRSSSPIPRPLWDFSPDHFKEVDRRALAKFNTDESSKKVESKTNGTNHAEQPNTTLLDSSEDEDEVDQGSKQDGKHDAVLTSSPKSSSPVSSSKSPDEESTPTKSANVTRPVSLKQKNKNADDIPKKTQAAKVTETVGRRNSSSAGSSVSTPSKVTDTEQPEKRGRGRPKGSKGKTKPQTESNKKSAPSEKKPVEYNPDGTVKKRPRGRPPGSKSKKKSEVDETIKSPEPDPQKEVLNTTAEGNIADSEPATNTVPSDTVKTTSKPIKRKRKDDAPEPVKRAKKTSETSDVANADAMIESADREAVVNAIDVMDIDSSSVETEDLPSPQPKSKPLAKQEEEIPAADIESDTDSSRGSSEEPQAEIVTSQKSTLDLPPAPHDSSPDSSPEPNSQDEPELPPLYSKPSSSADQASAQLQFEDTASHQEAKSTKPQPDSSIAQRPVANFSASRTKYPPFSDIRKQKASQASQQPANPKQTNSPINRKAVQPEHTSSDTSESSSESDSESDDQRPNTNGKAKNQSSKWPKGFHALMKTKGK